MSSDEHLKQAVKNVESKLEAIGKRLASRASTPMSCNYKPELDTTPLLGPEDATYYMNLIGILRWAVELGRIDIYLETSLMSAYNAAPRTGHLEQLYHIFTLNHMTVRKSYSTILTPFLTTQHLLSMTGHYSMEM